MSKSKTSSNTETLSDKRADKNQFQDDNRTPGSYKYGHTKVQASGKLLKQKKTPRRKVAENTEEYEVLLSLSGNVPGIRSKRMNIAHLITKMEDLYTARFIKDTSHFKAQLKKGSREEISEKPFPNFIHEFYLKKHKKNNKLIQQSVQDLVYSIEFHRKNDPEADLFANFLTLKYDTRDLVFFLYTRCLLEKEVGIKFSAYGKVNPIKVIDPREIYLTMKT